MKSFEIIRALENTPGKNDKTDIVRQGYESGNREFFIGARMAYNALVTYGVKAIVRFDEVDDTPSTVTFADFCILAEKLRLRELTGHAARDAINDFADKCSTSDWNDFYRRILLKDFKVGITESTINKVLKDIGKKDKAALDYIVPTYACQLAPSESYNRNTISQLRGKVYIDVKWDGMRLNTVLDKEAGTVIQYTRSGQVKENFPHITNAMKGLMEELPASVMIDGEIVGEDFTTLMKAASASDRDTSDTRLMIFDMVPLADFRAGYCAKTQEERHEALCALAESGMLAKHMGDLGFVLPKVLLDLDTEEGQAELARMFEDVMEKRKVSKKYEGLMAKKPDAPYRCKRWDGWEKVKPFVDASLEVVGIELGGADTKNANSVGALICRGQEGDKIIEVKVGSGMTQDERDRWAADPSLVMGFIAEVEGHEFSQDEKNRGTNVWSIRHPRLKGWRGSKPGEKL